MAYLSFKIDHEIEWNNASIITYNPRYFQIKNMFGGVAYINNVDDPLNRDDGNLFPEACRHLIDKHKKNNTDTINTGPPVDDSNP